MSGHYNSFGPTSVIPKKRLDRIVMVSGRIRIYIHIKATLFRKKQIITFHGFLVP